MQKSPYLKSKGFFVLNIIILSIIHIGLFMKLFKINSLLAILIAVFLFSACSKDDNTVTPTPNDNEGIDYNGVYYFEKGNIVEEKVYGKDGIELPLSEVSKNSFIDIFWDNYTYSKTRLNVADNSIKIEGNIVRSYDGSQLQGVYSVRIKNDTAYTTIRDEKTGKDVEGAIFYFRNKKIVNIVGIISYSTGSTSIVVGKEAYNIKSVLPFIFPQLTDKINVYTLIDEGIFTKKN